MPDSIENLGCFKLSYKDKHIVLHSDQKPSEEVRLKEKHYFTDEKQKDTYKKYALGFKNNEFHIYDLTKKFLGELEKKHEDVKFLGKVELSADNIYLSPRNITSHVPNSDNTKQLEELYLTLKQFKDAGFNLNQIKLGEEWTTWLFKKQQAIYHISPVNLAAGSLVANDTAPPLPPRNTKETYERLEAMYRLYEELRKRGYCDFEGLKGSILDGDPAVGMQIESRIKNDNSTTCNQLTFDEVVGIGFHNKAFRNAVNVGVEKLLAEDAADRILERKFASKEEIDQLTLSELKVHVADKKHAKQAFINRLKEKGLKLDESTTGESSCEAIAAAVAVAMAKNNLSNKLADVGKSFTNEAKGGPTVTATTDDSVGYYPYLKAHEKEHYKNPSIEVNIPNITENEFAALKNTLFEASKLYANGNLNNPKYLVKDQLDSYCKVYADSSIDNTNDTNKFCFKIKDNSAFDVNLNPGKGISLTFSEKEPSTQAIAAAAGVLHDIVGTYEQKKKVVGLVIRNYEDKPINALAIYCSLMCQTASVRFEPIFTTDNPLGAKKLAELLQEFAKTPDGKDQMLQLVEDDNTQLKKLVGLVNIHPDDDLKSLIALLGSSKVNNDRNHNRP